MNMPSNNAVALLGKAIARTEEDMQRAAEDYAKACDWLARNLTASAASARDNQTFVGGNVMGSSLVQDITRLEETYRQLHDRHKLLNRMGESLEFYKE